MLREILTIAIVISVVVCTGMILLIVLNKARRDRRQRRRDRRAAELEPRVMAFARGELASLRRPRGRIERGVLESILLEAAAGTRGAERTRLTGALEELGYVGGYLRALGSRSWWRRAAAADKLGQAHAERAVRALSIAVDDRVPEVGLRAATALAAIQGSSAVPLALRLLDESDRWTAIRVARILSRRPRQVADELREAFPEMSRRGRLAALDILGAIGSIQAAPWLRGCLVDPDPDVRSRAADALGALGLGESTPALIRALADPAWPVRATSAKALGKIGSSTAIEPLATLLRDPEWWVRTNAATALGGLGPEGIAALRRAVDEPDRYATHQAILTLELRGVVDDDVERLAAADPSGRASALALVDGLVRVGQRQRLDELAASHPDPGVRRALNKRLPPASAIEAHP